MIECFIDGACRGNGVDGKTGHAALGIAVYRNRKMVGQYCRPLGERTSNEAEYEALIHALFWCWTLSSVDSDFLSPTIYTDSLLVVNQVTGVWNCKSPTLLPLLQSVLKFSESGYRYRLQHVKRRNVWEADALANLVLDDIMEKVEDEEERSTPDA